LNIEDFVENSYYSFEAKTYMWKKEVDIFLNIPENMNNEIFLENHMDIINNEMDFIENNKDKIKEVLYDEDLLELAENITSSAYLLKCKSDECYMLEDGSTVSFPISKDDFLDNIYIETIAINFNEEKEIISSELILSCDPDYFKGSYFIVDIDIDKNIKFELEK
jgi:hypothetical protein